MNRPTFQTSGITRVFFEIFSKSVRYIVAYRFRLCCCFGWFAKYILGCQCNLLDSSFEGEDGGISLMHSSGVCIEDVFKFGSGTSAASFHKFTEILLVVEFDDYGNWIGNRA